MVRTMVVKFHLPIALNSSWCEDFERTKTEHPIFKNTSSASLDLAITLICVIKPVIQVVGVEAYDIDAYIANNLMLTTAIAMTRMLAQRNKLLAGHFNQFISTLERYRNEMRDMTIVMQNRPMFVCRPIKYVQQEYIWKKMLTFRSYNELMESIPDHTCAICITADIRNEDRVFLDNCRYAFCLPCISVFVVFVP